MKSERILLVEDERTLLDNISLNLELEGYEVKKADNGYDAIEMLKNEQFNAVVLDIMLPRINGLAVCEYARLNNNNTPILFLSARSSAQDRIAGLKTGADDYLTKPFDLEELILRVQRLVEKSKLKDVLSPQTGVEDEFHFGGHNLSFSRGIVKLASGEERVLTKKENQVMKLFVEHANTLVTREHLLHAVWGYSVFPSTRTIDNFVLSLRKIFEPDPSKPIYFHARRSKGFEFTPNGVKE